MESHPRPWRSPSTSRPKPCLLDRQAASKNRKVPTSGRFRQKWAFCPRYNSRIIPTPHPGAAFPIYIHAGPFTIHPHLFFEALAYAVAFVLYLILRRRFGDPIATPIRWSAVAAAVAGAALGAKVLYFLEDPTLTLANLHNPAYFIGGKTIVGALAGGLITVELIKRYIGLRTSTGDLYAIPLAAGIAIGRIGCFLTGLSDNTYGTPTKLPWGVDFGDGILRHPTQIYEIVFLLFLIPVLYVIQTRIVILSEAVTSEATEAQSKDPYSHFKSAPSPEAQSSKRGALQPGDAFKLFMLAYVTFRLLADFIKPYPHLFLGLGGIQWACVLILLYYSPDILRWISQR